MSEASSNTTHWAIGAILLFIGAFVVVALVLVYSQADSVETQTTISNANPAVDSIFVSDSSNGLANDFGSGITVAPNGQATIHINGVVSDANGQSDIDNVSMTWYRSSATDTCEADSNYCIKIANCQLSANNDTTKKYNCAALLDYYADATDPVGRYPADIWKTKISVTDKNGGGGNLTTSGANDVEVNTQLSLNIPPAINYGTVTNNTDTDAGSGIVQTLTQYGNDVADVNVSGTLLTCSGTGADIPAGNQQWALTDVGYNGSGATSITGTPTDTNIGVGYRDAGVVTKPLYWNIAIPYNAIGSCTGTNTISTIAA